MVHNGEKSPTHFAREKLMVMELQDKQVYDAAEPEVTPLVGVIKIGRAHV